MAENNFLVIFKDNSLRLFYAEDIDELLFKVAEYFGVDKPIAKIGITDCTEIEDKIEMYNTFATMYDDEIAEIHEVKRRIY